MFYSHEILSNSQYGVATIWLVATTGRATQKRLTKKAIQEVNVPKACGTILDPGAPLALRLQGNLLYGVSRVFSHQCNYVLSDAEKTQSDMMTFFRVMQTSETDPQAGKAKRHQITLEDDPSFDPWSAIPNLELLDTQYDWTASLSQASVKHSQFSPANASSQDPLTPDRMDPFFGFDLPASSKSGGSYRIPSDLAGHSSLLAKETRGADTMGEFRPFEVDDDFHPLNDIGLEFDADGNMIGLVGLDEEPELPPLPLPQEDHAKNLQQLQVALAENPEQDLFGTGDEGVLIMGEDVLPDADGFATRAAAKGSGRTYTQSTETTETEQAVALLRRTRVRKHKDMMDPRINLRMADLKEHEKKYPVIMAASLNERAKTTTAHAKKNALGFLFGQGIAGVGSIQAASGIPHPLADEFSGINLLANLQGVPAENLQGLLPRPRGRRRKVSEVVEEQTDQQERRVRQRVDEGQEVGRDAGVVQEDQFMLGDDSIPEIGMEAQAAMEDRHSSSMMPWSRAGSVAPGSSVRGHGSVREGLQAHSPLFGSAAKLQHKHHDALPSMGPDDFGLLHSQDSSMNYAASHNGFNSGSGDNSQAQSGWLDLASQDFLGYATDQATKTGTTRDGDSSGLRWIEF